MGRWAVVFGMALLAACAADSGEGPPDEAQAGRCQDCRNFFSIKNLALTQVEGPSVRARLEAESAVGRPRRGRLVQFDNYDEIYLNHVRVEQAQSGAIVRLDLRGFAKALGAFDERAPASPEESIIPAPGESGGPPAAEAAEDDSAKHWLSRLLADDIRIKIQPAGERPVLLSAGRATLGIEAGLVKFEQDVRLQAAHCALSAPLAIWSGEHDGLYLPAEYRLNGKTRPAGGFLRISSAGRCAKLKPAPQVEYVDALDTVENQLFQAVPLSMRLLFGFMGVPAEIPR